MQTGISPEWIEAQKERLRRWRRNPRKYRLAVAVALFLVGYGLVLRPLVGRLTQARTQLDEARGIAEQARELRSLEAQAGLYSDRVSAAAEFERYVVGHLREVGLAVDGLENKGLTDMEPFRLATLALDATGTYAQVVEFIDHIERGERLARIDNLQIDPGKARVVFQCDVLGLVRVDG